jgi:hypothetical protein
VLVRLCFWVVCDWLRERCVPYPLQLSQRKGRRSSWWQKGIWQWAPIASTSPVDILLKDSVGLVFCEAMMGGWV